MRNLKFLIRGDIYILNLYDLAFIKKTAQKKIVIKQKQT